MTYPKRLIEADLPIKCIIYKEFWDFKEFSFHFKLLDIDI